MTTLTLKPADDSQRTAQSEMVKALHTALDARRQRIVVSQSGVGTVKWAGIRSLKMGDFVMPVDHRDAWIRAYLEDVFNGHNLQSLDKYMTENLVSHWLGDRSLHGREAWREAMAKFFDAFPDAAYTLNDLFSQATKVCGEEPGMPRNVSSGREFRNRPQGEVDRDHYRPL